MTPIEKWINTYKHLELDNEAMSIYEDEYVKNYSGSLDKFRAMYFQTFVDINTQPLKSGDEIYYVFGKSLSRGIIEKIDAFQIGKYLPRIKIKGKKNLVWSNQIVKI